MGSILQTETVLDVIRRELRRVSPDVKIDNEEIRFVLVNEVMKRDVFEGDKAQEAAKKVNKASQRQLRSITKQKISSVRNESSASDEETLSSGT